MFDLRYHVVSLAAVFLALIIGILIGVGISSGGFLKNSERSLLNRQIADLQDRLDAATTRAGELSRSQRAAQTFVKDTYPALMEDRLSGKRVALVFVGSASSRLLPLVQRVLADSGAAGLLRLRALKVPIDAQTIEAALAKRPALAAFVGDDRLDELGRRLAQEFASGGNTPLWQALSSELVEERSGNDRRPADGVVVVRATPPQRGATARLLAGLYTGLASLDVPAVGVETTGASTSAVEAYAKHDLSTVDDADTPAGRVALALLLAGAERGHYGVKQTAKSGLLPPVEPVRVPSKPGG